jgi:hypothetical protein
VKRNRLVGWQDRLLREAACEWAAHLHDEPQDDKDLACRRRWERLARAAYEYARATGALPWVK